METTSKDNGTVKMCWHQHTAYPITFSDSEKKEWKEVIVDDKQKCPICGKLMSLYIAEIGGMLKEAYIYGFCLNCDKVFNLVDKSCD